MSYFYPRPPRGGRRFSGFLLRCQRIFLSTPSARRATLSVLDTSVTATVFLSTPSARRATNTNGCLVSKIGISIHALREEGDPAWERQKQPRYLFLSTPSARRATRHSHHRDSVVRNFYPRPPRGGRPWRGWPTASHGYFYPRPPRGGRHRFVLLFLYGIGFLSTPSARRATADLPA